MHDSEAEIRPKAFRLWNRDLHESHSRKEAQTISILKSWISEFNSEKSLHLFFDLGIVVYGIPKPTEGPKRFDFGIVMYTIPKAERRPKAFRLWNRNLRDFKAERRPNIIGFWNLDLHEPQSRNKGQISFDFGIVVYTTPKAEERPKPFRLWNHESHDFQSREKAQSVWTLES